MHYCTKDPSHESHFEKTVRILKRTIKPYYIYTIDVYWADDIFKWMVDNNACKADVIDQIRIADIRHKFSNAVLSNDLSLLQQFKTALHKFEQTNEAVVTVDQRNRYQEFRHWNDNAVVTINEYYPGGDAFKWCQGNAPKFAPAKSFEYKIKDLSL